MNCERGERELAAYCESALAAGERAAFGRHLAGCAECGELVEMWDGLGALPEPIPAAGMQRRFDRALALEKPRLPQWLGWAAAAVLLLGAGWAVGRQGSEVTALRDEVRHLRSVVALSMLAQDSASARLQGISYAGELREGPRDVIGALVAALRHDSNVNVRLAAGDALRRYRADPQVRRAFVEALGSEESPLVKVTLIDALVEFRERDSVTPLRRLSEATQEDGSVRARAVRALEQMKSKGTSWQ